MREESENIESQSKVAEDAKKASYSALGESIVKLTVNEAKALGDYLEKLHGIRSAIDKLTVNETKSLVDYLLMRPFKGRKSTAVTSAETHNPIQSIEEFTANQASAVIAKRLADKYVLIHEILKNNGIVNGLEPETFLDALWVTRRQKPALPQSQDNATDLETDDITSVPNSNFQDEQRNIKPEQTERLTEEVEDEDEEIPNEEATNDDDEPVATKPRTPIQIRGIQKNPSLQSSYMPNRNMVRAIGHLSRVTNLDSMFELNESATIDQWIETQLRSHQLAKTPILPVFSLVPEKQTSVALVIDSSIGMELWADITETWRKTIQNCGYFRTVRDFILETDYKEPRLRHSGNAKHVGRVGDGSSPIFGTDEVVLVISHVSSPAWQNGNAYRLLGEWSKEANVAILSLLPERHWRRSSLDDHGRTFLEKQHTHKPWVDQFTKQPSSDRVRLIPVASLRNFYSLEAICLVMGQNRFPVFSKGIRVQIRQEQGEFESLEDVTPRAKDKSADRRVQDFLNMASNEGIILARMFAKCQSHNLKWLRALGEELRSKQNCLVGLNFDRDHEAEILLLGILKMKEDSENKLHFDFHDGVRPLLQKVRLSKYTNLDQIEAEVLAEIERKLIPQLGGDIFKPDVSGIVEKLIYSSNDLSTALDRIRYEKNAKTGTLDLGMLDLKGLPHELFELKHLERLNLGSRWMDSSRRLNNSTNDITKASLSYDLSGLYHLPKLTDLSLSDLQIKNLTSLAGLTQLQSLSCEGTQVSDLTPLAGLSQLQSLYCGGTQVSDLTPLVGLTQLQSLDCRDTPVSDLTPLAGMTQLQSLNCVFTQVSDLTPLVGLTQLQSLGCGGTPVSDLTPLVGLTQLQALDCWDTQVSDLTPLAELNHLQSLNCSDTQISDLMPLAGLIGLNTIRLFNTEIETIPDWLVRLPHLEKLYISSTNVRGIPVEILSKDWFDNCIHRLRAHFDDLAKGAERFTDVKLIVIGNGQIGKTKICQRLSGNGYDPSADSTHGIVVRSVDKWPLDDLPGCEGQHARLNLWDFGGQDLYHGTHTLFFNSRSIFMIVWTPMSEEAESHTFDGVSFPNRRLPYWLENIRHAAGTDQPVIIVQNQCDTAEQEEPLLPVDAELLNLFKHKKICHYSALNDRNRSILKNIISEAIYQNWQHHGDTEIGKGRMRVIREIEKLRKSNPQGKNRTITRKKFNALCNKKLDVSSPEMFLQFLNDTGVIMYSPNLFKSKIIIDQNWALQAVYSIFDRSKSYYLLKRMGGQFTQTDLQKTVWQRYSIEEQELFLSWMVSCGICFVYSESNPNTNSETVYLAPELLPEISSEYGLFAVWETFSEPIQEFDVFLPYLQPGLIQSLICNLGKRAQSHATYAKTGLCFKDLKTNSLCRIEQLHYKDKTRHSGRFQVRTRAGDSARLLAKMRRSLEWILNQHLGFESGWKFEVDDRLSRIESQLNSSFDDSLKQGSNPSMDIAFEPPTTVDSLQPVLLTESEWDRVEKIMSRISFNREVSRRSLIIDMKLNTGMSPWAGLIQIHATHDFIIQLIHEIQIPQEPLIERNLLKALLIRARNFDDRKWLDQRLFGEEILAPANPKDLKREDRIILIEDLHSLTEADFRMFVTQLSGYKSNSSNWLWKCNPESCFF